VKHIRSISPLEAQIDMTRTFIYVDGNDGRESQTASLRRDEGLVERGTLDPMALTHSHISRHLDEDLGSFPDWSLALRYLAPGISTRTRHVSTNPAGTLSLACLLLSNSRALDQLQQLRAPCTLYGIGTVDTVPQVHQG
jgi:hypothetical protein